MRFHLLGLAHTRTTKDYLSCAFTQKVFNLSRMLVSKGHEVIHYGAEGADVPCEHVTVVPEVLFHQYYNNYNWHNVNFRYDWENPAFDAYVANSIREINARKRPDDILLSTFGLPQKPIFDGVDIPLKVESGVGYSGVFAPYRVFESQTWKHYIWGRYGTENDNGRWYDVVIPNSFDPNDFIVEDYKRKDDYFLYLGRVIQRKGIEIAAQVCERLGAKLLVVGQDDGDGQLLKKYKCVEQRVSVQNVKERAELLAHARAVFCPTIYIEPFGGVAVEAMMAGTPVITSDFGAFTETVQQGVTGWRCQNFDDFVQAAKHPEMDYEAIRNYASTTYSHERCATMYDDYFNRLYCLLSPQGWYQIRR